ncbi:MAG: TIR domain-containing protein [Halanaerobiales bacterium]|nr:TIR domain-containing protein [Halanaerobiales bacterium]
MAYRNGTYIAFHADGTNIPCDSDIKYYNLIKAWTSKKEDQFSFINSHEKTNAVRDSSKKRTLERRLKKRLRNSKNMVLILGETTKNDRDWIPFEISYAVDKCKIPIIVAYINYEYITAPKQFSYLWPESLKERIKRGTLSAIHIPFKKAPLSDAISQFDYNNKPKGGSLGIYSKDAYRSFGINIK